MTRSRAIWRARVVARGERWLRDIEARGGHGDALRREIVETSLAHRVLSRFTAFVAVDERKAVTDPSSRRKWCSRCTCRAARGQVPVAVQAWLDRMVEVLDRLLHLLHQQRRLEAEVRAAATELGQLAHPTPGLRRKGGRWRFWESGV